MKLNILSEKKRGVLILNAILASFCAFSYDWPQGNTELSSFFGQIRGSTISTSMIFSETSEIKASEPGKAVLYIREYQDDTDFFPSTLGNALILSHSDNLVTVSRIFISSISSWLYPAVLERPITTGIFRYPSTAPRARSYA